MKISQIDTEFVRNTNELRKNNFLRLAKQSMMEGITLNQIYV